METEIRCASPGLGERGKGSDRFMGLGVLLWSDKSVLELDTRAHTILINATEL